MKICMIFLGLLFSISVCTAYNYFQGFLHLGEPCFPVHDHEDCQCNLEDVFTPKQTALASIKPATQFFLFTPDCQETAEQLHLCGGRLPPGSTFDTRCPTEVLIHGYSDGPCRTAWMREIKAQYYLKKCSCFNVILVDWTWGNLIDIASAAVNAKGVGEQVAYVLKNISKQTKYNTRNFHIVAHSYGVTVASYAGKNMPEPAYRLGRITAMDAALPPLKYAPEEERLNPNDALFVDVIHTNGGECFPFNIGDPRPMGHVDMYVGDGVHQYSCKPYAYESLLKLDYLYAFGSAVYTPLCYHVQSIQYYKTSINADQDGSYMVGVLCDSLDDYESGKCSRNCQVPGKCAPLGYDLPQYIDTSYTGRRTYQVPSSLHCPYANHSGFSGLPLTPIGY